MVTFPTAELVLESLYMIYYFVCVECNIRSQSEQPIKDRILNPCCDGCGRPMQQQMFSVPVKIK